MQFIFNHNIIQLKLVYQVQWWTWKTSNTLKLMVSDIKACMYSILYLSKRKKNKYSSQFSRSSVMSTVKERDILFFSGLILVG